VLKEGKERQTARNTVSSAQCLTLPAAFAASFHVRQTTFCFSFLQACQMQLIRVFLNFFWGHFLLPTLL